MWDGWIGAGRGELYRHVFACVFFVKNSVSVPECPLLKGNVWWGKSTYISKEPIGNRTDTLNKWMWHLTLLKKCFWDIHLDLERKPGHGQSEHWGTEWLRIWDFLHDLIFSLYASLLVVISWKKVKKERHRKTQNDWNINKQRRDNKEIQTYLGMKGEVMALERDWVIECR